MLPHVLRGACNKQLRELSALDGTAHTTRFLAAALLFLQVPRRQERRKLSVKYLVITWATYWLTNENR